MIWRGSPVHLEICRETFSPSHKDFKNYSLFIISLPLIPRISISFHGVWVGMHITCLIDTLNFFDIVLLFHASNL